MEDNNFLVYAAASVILSVLSVLTLFYAPFEGIFAGAFALLVLVSWRLAVSKSKVQSKTSTMKILLFLTPPIHEAVLLAGVSLSPIIPDFLKVLTVGVVLMAYLVRIGLVKELRETVKPSIGRELRLTILSAGLILSYFNVYFLFYSFILVVLMAVYDILTMLRDKMV